MTEVQAVPQSSIDADIVSGVAQFLGPVVVDLTALGSTASRRTGTFAERTSRPCTSFSTRS